MFDQAKIMVKAGDGGDGAISFRREKFVPFGGPDGGDGGDGGDVVLMADPGVASLRLFRRRRLYRAGKGGDGRSQKKHGRRGEDLILLLPVGTVALDRAGEGGEVVFADLEIAGQRVVAAGGGRGGRGNVHFASATNQTPRLAQKGEAGEERSIVLELRLIADVGIIGYPNVGKSTLLAAASAARPKIASYPFTTLEPVLGVVEVGQRSFVMADIPGLIDGAHLGRGLGHDFLRHIMRTKMLVHLIDGASDSPVEDMAQVNSELALFDSALAEKAQLVAVNKTDLPQVKARLAELKRAFSYAGTRISFISAATGEGVDELMTEVLGVLRRVDTAAESARKKAPPVVFRPRPRDTGAGVRREGDAFVLLVPELERIVSRVDMSNPEARWQLRGQMARMGIDRALEKAGIKPGDKVRCGLAEWEW